jgi:ankyrin repeat protein
MQLLGRVAFIALLIIGARFAHATPLHDAARTGDTAKAAALIMDDPSAVNVRDLSGSTPLSLAAQEGQLEMVKLLLDKGAAIEVKVNYRGAPPATVAFYADPATLKLLSTKSPIDAIGATPLYIAAKEGHTAIAEALLAKGAAVDSEESMGNTPLYIAAQEGHVEVVKLLLEKGARIEGKRSDRVTPLATAAQQGQLQVVELLLEKGAAVEAKDSKGVTPLARAAQGRNGLPVQRLEVIKVLLAKGANPDTLAHDPLGRRETVLELAEKQGNTEIAELLRQANPKQSRVSPTKAQ